MIIFCSTYSTYDQHVRKIVLSADEFLIVELLNQAVAAHPSVSFGSYPYFSNPAFKTVSVPHYHAQCMGGYRGAVSLLKGTGRQKRLTNQNSSVVANLVQVEYFLSKTF